MRRVLAALVACSVLLPASGLAGPLHSEEMLAQYFRLEWAAAPGARGPAIAGHVENISNLPFDRMELRVESLDVGGAVVGTTRAWVMGVVVPNHRSYFTAAVPSATSYRVTIAAFNWSNCRD